MTTYNVRVALRIDGSPGDVDAFTDRLLETLSARNAGADLGGSLASGAFDVWVTEEASSATDAVLRGSTTARVAAHEARGTVALGDEWPDGVRQTGVEANEVVAAVV